MVALYMTEFPIIQRIAMPRPRNNTGTDIIGIYKIWFSFNDLICGMIRLRIFQRSYKYYEKDRSRYNRLDFVCFIYIFSFKNLEVLE
jgi:hypothetical protein